VDLAEALLGLEDVITQLRDQVLELLDVVLEAVLLRLEVCHRHPCDVLVTDGVDDVVCVGVMHSHDAPPFAAANISMVVGHRGAVARSAGANQRSIPTSRTAATRSASVGLR